jgi:hypothetical protein
MPIEYARIISKPHCNQGRNGCKCIRAQNHARTVEASQLTHFESIRRETINGEREEERKRKTVAIYI